jgi:Tfp pilus assembly protein PilV
MTLVEVMVALLIIVVALLPLLSMVPAGTELHLQTREACVAGCLAQQKLDEVCARLTKDFAAAVEAAGAFAAHGEPGYRYTVTVSQDPQLPLKHITVVCWRDRNADATLSAGETSVRLDTLVSRRR